MKTRSQVMLPKDLPSLYIKKYNNVLRYAHFSYAKCSFTNIQKQQNTLKSSLLSKKNTNFTGITRLRTKEIVDFKLQHKSVVTAHPVDV